MTHTQIVDRHDMIVPGKAGSYTDRPAGGFALALANWEQTGDGAVNTTVEDLAIWDRNFYTGAVGGSAAIREIETPGVLNDGKPINYALGLRIDSLHGVRQVSHGGSWAGFRAQVSRFPERKVSVFTLCNLSSSAPWMLTDAVANLVLGLGPPTAEPPRPRIASMVSATPDRTAPTGLAGVYHTDELMADWRLTVRHDSLFGRAGLGAEFLLEPAGRDRFTALGTRVTVHRTGERVTGITLDDRGLRNFPLARTGDVP
jgi:hypothetical protein